MEEDARLNSIENLEAVRLSGAELLASVLALHPGVAVFDCDGTLWSGDAGYGFMVWSIERGLVSRNASDWIDSRYRLYRTGEVSELAMCGEMVQIYAGLREEELRRAAAEYFHAHIEGGIFAEMRQLVERLRAAGTQIWAVSSTNNWVIEEGVKPFGIPAERVLAVKVKAEDGVLTSELLDVPTDEGKAVALARAGVTQPDAVFGNSIHDASMLEMAQYPFPVNPTPALAQLAARNGWPVFFPAA